MKTIRIVGTFALLAFLLGCSSARIRSDWDPRSDFKNLRTYSWIDADLSRSGYPALQSPLVAQRIQNAVDGELAARGYRRVDTETPDFRIAFQIVANGQSSGLGVDKKKPERGYSPYRSSGAAERAGRGPLVTAYASAAYSHQPLVYTASRRHVRRIGRSRYYGYRYRPYGYRPYGYRGYYGRGFYRGGFGYGHSFGYGYPHGTEEKIKSTLVLDVYDGTENTLLWRGWAIKDLPENPKPTEVQKYVQKSIRKILKEFPPED